MAQIKLFLCSLVLLGAAVSALQHDTLAADFCGVRANAACAKKGCAGAQSPAALPPRVTPDPMPRTVAVGLMPRMWLPLVSACLMVPVAASS
jgi:hypothetical protein